MKIQLMKQVKSDTNKTEFLKIFYLNIIFMVFGLFVVKIIEEL